MKVKLEAPVADLSRSALRLGKDYKIRNIVLTKYQTVAGWTTMISGPFENSIIHSIMYLGECAIDGSMFVVHAYIKEEVLKSELIIYICKGYFEK